MTNFLYNIYPILPETFIILNVCILLIYGVLTSASLKYGYPLVSFNLGFLTLQILLFSFLLTLQQDFVNLTVWNGFLINDFFTYNSKCLIIFITCGWLLGTFRFTINEKINSFEYWILILLAVVAMLFILQSCDLLMIYLSVEFQSLIFYVLASFKRTSEFSTEAGLKYFVLGAFSSALLLFGSSLIYGLTGLTNLSDISKFFTGIALNQISLFFGTLTGLTLITVSLLFKLSAAPFHMWAPDVYEGSPTSVTAFFSILPKLAIISLLFRFLIFTFHDFLVFWQNIILIGVILSVLIGILSAFYQTKWKRFFAYSSISHVGFFLLALLSGDSEGISSSVFYIIIYMITMLGIFAFIVTLRFYNYPKHYQTRYLKDLSILANTNPVVALSVAILLFSMAGIPPLAGFFSKIFVILSALQANALGVSVFIVLMSCIACFYYIKLIKDMYFEVPLRWETVYPVDKVSSIVLGFSLFFTLFLIYDIEIISIPTILMSLSFLN